MENNILDFDTVCLSEDGEGIKIIDQTRLPGEITFLTLKTDEEIWRAINILQVRGAPAIGVTAALAMYVLSLSMPKTSYADFARVFAEKKAYLDSSRPTAVNLSWALKKMEKVVLDHEGTDPSELIPLLKEEALRIYREDIEVCHAIGENGLTLVKKGDGILTHCNAGKLCAVQYGTATAPIYLGHERGYNFRVFCDETRPLLQGARLTSFELVSAGVDTTVICDNMSGMVMKKGWVNAVFVGCDRVAANGDTANKIGTSVVAAVAKQYGVPMYICAPTSTIDLSTPTGEEIVIEERKPDEVTEMWYKERMAPKNVKVFNPAFDVTDASLITAIVTEKGIAYPPYTKTLREMVEKE
ncbi:MAG: S-methyl-5-thioribose-1-phosphate isomerase [Lachnospiraceae bacterium]|nr:S-methyl-5-thioribose-1-phosphate isomerase [Lachnospiraceae bacterium]